MDKSAKYQDFSVVKRAVEAFESLAANDVAKAASILQCASAEDADRRAGNAQIVDTANKALGAHLAGNRRDALEMLARAATLTDEMTGALSTNDSRPRASSSGHHFRLASMHPNAFAKASVARQTNLYGLMRAIIVHHEALLRGGSEISRAHKALSVAIADTFGADSVETRLTMSRTINDIADCYRARAEKLRAITRYAPSRAALTPEIALAAMVILPCLPPFTCPTTTQLKERA